MPTSGGQLVAYQMGVRHLEGGDGDDGGETETLSAQLITFSLFPTSVHTKTQSVRIPVKGGRTDPYPCPNGDRMVWRVRSSIAQQRKESLWVSRLDGSNARRLLEIDWNAPSYALAFTNLAWLPDGKRISFVYERSLWILPTE